MRQLSEETEGEEVAKGIDCYDSDVNYGYFAERDILLWTLCRELLECGSMTMTNNCLFGILSNSFSFLFIAVGAVPPQVREYCQSETFRATCPKNQVVVMKKALYGRMGTGRCLTDEFGNLGCEFDVLREMDNICSGTNSCEFKVDDSSFAAVKPFCHAQLKSYLLAGYDCVPGETQIIQYECIMIRMTF